MAFAVLAILVVAVMVTGSLGFVGPGFASPGAAATPPQLGAPTAVSDPTASSGTAAGASLEPGAGCTNQAAGIAPSVAAAAAAYVSPSGSTAAPLYNSQVEPFATYTGPYGYTAAGAAMRDQGYGQIRLTWSGSLVAAFLIWSIMADGVPAQTATLNGVGLTGTWTAYTTPTPCWSPTYIYTFAADVSSLIINGTNQLTNFPSALTDGSNPWTATGEADLPMLEGASLVAIYKSGSSTTQQITVYTGALTEIEYYIPAQLNYTATTSRSAQTTFIVADGQIAGNNATWNGTQIDTNAFPGSDPRTSTTPWTYGNLFDTKTYAVSVPLGSNSTRAGIGSPSGDCLTWVGQVLSVEVAAPHPPYSVTFTEGGLPSGTTWGVTTNDRTTNETVGSGPNSITFPVGNGTYPYSVIPIPGYAARYTGSYQVDGGSVYLRVPFHQLQYTLNFTESELPASQGYWWVDLTNTSQGLASNVSVYQKAYIDFTVANGTYHFFAGSFSSFYPAIPGSGSIAVTGPTARVISFPGPPLYTITFAVEGLPGGTVWGASVSTNFGTFSNLSIVAPHSFAELLPNSTSSDEVTPDSVVGYYSAATAFTVSGASKVVEVVYEKLFNIYFNTTTLPASVSWEVSVHNTNYSVTGFSGTGALHNVTATAPNGTFTFTVYSGSSIYTPVPATGDVSVTGAKALVSIVFTHPPFYNLTVVAVGLPPRTTWSAEVEATVGDTSISTNASSYTLQLPNTTGTITQSNAGSQFTNPVTPFGIHGGPRTIDLNFSRLYTISFPETGTAYDAFYLAQVYNASGVTYLTEGEGDGGVTPATVQEPNGTYTVKGDATGYTAVPPSMSFTVEGSALVVPLEFLKSGDYLVKFNAVGLPTGVRWTVVLNGVSQNATWSSIAFGSLDGTFSYFVQASDGYAPNPASGSTTVSGIAQSVNITFTAHTAYTVTFTETGLPSGIWSITLNGSTNTSVFAPHGFAAAGGTNITFAALNGTYGYSVGSVTGYTSSPSSGSVTVNGAAVVVGVTFTRVASTKYTVTFTESGLTGERWAVTFNGTTGPRTTATTTTFQSANGTYAFNVSNVAGWRAAEYSGTVTVDGGPTGPTVVWTQQRYALTFTETGLTGERWAVTFNGTTEARTTSSTIVLQSPNGSYPYNVSNVAGWRANAYSATVAVNGAPAGPLVTWTQETYTTTFTETGLTGEKWAVTFNGTLGARTAGTSVTFQSPNGTYHYNISNVAGWRANGYSGTVSTNGQGNGLTVTWTQQDYTITFKETGLTGEKWAVTFNGSLSARTTATKITFQSPNGTYRYNVSNVAGWRASSYSGTVGTSGSATGPTVTWTQQKYTVTFTESGLTGEKWAVTFNGSLSAGTTATKITFQSPNGTYHYTVSSVAGWHANAYSGSVSVKGKATGPTVTWTQEKYTVTFTETGLAAGTSWSVKVNGTTTKSTTSSLSFTEPNGTISYKVGSVSGYTASPTSGTVAVKGAAKTVKIQFTKTSSPAPGSTTAPSIGAVRWDTP